jgi:undecaprenyl diphosphate synthase
VVRHASRRGIGVLTLYAFSRENWNRPEGEVDELMSLMRRYIDTDLEELAEHGIRIRVIGSRDGLSGKLAAMIERAESRTAANDGMTLQVAFNYGGRDEIVRAARRAARAAAAGEVDPGAIDEASFAGFMDTAAVPDPDLLIRTSGEQRISNFLLWQCAYAEFVFSEAMWPEFDEDAFDAALDVFRLRERRFGEVSARAARRQG